MTMLRMTKALRVAIYARYSTDLQNPASIADQVLLCRDIIEKNFPGAVIVRVGEDAAISGATMERPGLVDLLSEIAEGRVDVLIAEGLDRISRNLGDMARIHHLCRNSKCRIFTGHEGEVSDLHIGFKGTMNAMFLADLKEKVRRAHRASVLAGRAVSSQAYGYRVVRGVTDERGRYVNGLREIFEPEAAVVRRIFELVADGVPVRSVVRILNDEGIASPSGKQWGAPSIIGSKARQAGILNNELYRGRIIWNRTRLVLDPQTGRRRYLINDASEHVIQEAPELRIVDDELWQRARETRRTMPAEFGAKVGRSKRRNPDLEHNPGNVAYALTGLVRCGACGGVKTLANARRYLCDTYRKTRDCKNARGMRDDEVAERLFAALISDLHEVSNLKATVKKLAAEAEAERLKREAEIQDLKARVNRLVELTETGGLSVEAPGRRIAELEQRIRELTKFARTPNLKLSEAEMKELLRVALAEIARNVGDRRLADPVRAALAKIVHRVTLTPILEQKTGVEVSFAFKEGGWAALYCHIFDAWPGVDRTEFEAG